MKNKMTELSLELLELIRTPKQQIANSYNEIKISDFDRVDYISEGSRNATMASMIGNYSKQGFSKESAYEYANSLNQTHFDPPLAIQELNNIVNSIYRYNNVPTSKIMYPKTYALTDVGTAQRFADMFGDKVRYVPELKGFLTYNGKRWLPAVTGEVERMARIVCKSIKEEGLSLQDSEQRKKLVKFAEKSESETRIKAMINLLKSEEHIAMSINDFDKNLMIFNCNNGTLNLKTGELMQHNHLNFITEMSPVDYDPEAKSPIFDKFLKTIFNGDVKLIKYLQRVIGYSLTGLNSEQCFFILQGSGSNGKSVFIDVIKFMLGGYACNSEFRTFTLTKSNQVRNDLARMSKARFVTAVEGDKKSLLDEAVIKSITGGDTVTARFLHKEYFDYTPRYKIFLVSNFLPKIDNSGHSIWRRIRVIPFDVIIAKKDQDKYLAQKLKSELSGIFNWAFEGCLEWQKYSLVDPQKVTNAVNKYRSSVDSANIFVKNCCEMDPESNVLFGKIYDDYISWCEENLYDIVSVKEFAHVLIDSGCESYRGFPGGDRGYKGIKVKQQFKGWGN